MYNWAHWKDESFLRRSPLIEMLIVTSVPGVFLSGPQILYDCPRLISLESPTHNSGIYPTQYHGVILIPAHLQKGNHTYNVWSNLIDKQDMGLSACVFLVLRRVATILSFFIFVTDWVLGGYRYVVLVVRGDWSVIWLISPGAGACSMYTTGYAGYVHPALQVQGSLQGRWIIIVHCKGSCPRRWKTKGKWTAETACQCVNQCTVPCLQSQNLPSVTIS